MSWNFSQSSIYKFYKIHQRKIFGGAAFLLLALFFLVGYRVFDYVQKPDLEVSFFDVWQGDSIFVESKDGTQILIDGGPPNRILPNLGSRMSFFDRFIDVVVLTHPHADHVSGLIEVLGRYNIGMIIESGVDYHTAEAKIFESLVAEKKLKKVTVDHPINLNFANGAVLKFIYPEESFVGMTLKNVHDSALVGELDFEDKKILFMSDAEKNLEKRLVEEGRVGDVDVLKTGHHGSKTSSNDFFLRVTKTEYAIISSGARNRYGHPAQEVLSRLASAGAQIFRTDLDGTITLEIRNGSLIWK